ncbi:MAG: putative cation efflux system protein [Firmicutes bacterium]|nr:putative cation efflux system protein [Bacillota bacterium]
MTLSERNQSAKNVAVLSMFSNIVLTIIRATVGLLAGSTAILADAANSASDILATAIVYVGFRLAGSPPDKTHHYGHAKLESVAAKIVALMIIATAIMLAINSLLILKRGNIEAPSSLALWAAVLSIVVKESIYRYVRAVGLRLKSTLLLADAWHHRSDAITSSAVLCGVVGAQLGYPVLDPLAGLAVSLLIGHTGVKIYAQSIRELIDEAPSEAVVHEIARVAETAEGVLSVTEVKARLVASRILVDIKICVNPLLTVAEGHHIGSRAKGALLKQMPQVGNVLVHVNPCHHMRAKDEVPTCATCQFHPSEPSEEAILCNHSS